VSALDSTAPRPAASPLGRVADRLLSPSQVPWRTWRRRQAVLTSALALSAAALLAVAPAGGSSAPRVAGGAAALVLVLLAVGAAPLLVPAAPVRRGLAAAAGAAGLVVAALALHALVGVSRPAALGVVHALLVAGLVAAHRAPGPVVAAAAAAALGRPALDALGLPDAVDGHALAVGAVGALAAAVLVARAVVARRPAAGSDRASREGTGRDAAGAADGPELVAAADRDDLRDLLVAHLLAHPGRGLALLLVGLVPAEGRDGAGTCADELLRAVTTRTAGAVRDGDVVVRLPEGELAVLVTGGTAESARRVGERVRAALSSGVAVAGALVDLDASVGAGGAEPGRPQDAVAAGARDAHEAAARCADRLLAEVDAALEVARGTGTGVAVVDPGEREGARLAELAQLRTDLHRALADDEDAPFLLRWRPRFDVRTGRWTTATAELAWTGGTRSPHALVAGTTLAPELLQLQLRRALRAVVAWRAAGVHVQAAVRVPGEALGRPGLVDLVAGALLETGADAAGLRLLVEDDDVAADPSAAAVAVARLAVLGVPASVTGLGASRSSVAGLGALPVDEVVVDARLVASLGGGHEADARLVRAVVGLGHGLGLRVVAAGVDDVAVHRAAVALGCDAVEGEHVGASAGSSSVADLVLGGEGGDLLAPARRPSLPAPRRAPGS